MEPVWSLPLLESQARGWATAIRSVRCLVSRGCCGFVVICASTTSPRSLDAAADGADVLACYVLDPRLTSSAGPRRLQFLYDSLRELHDALDGRLLVTRGQPETRIPNLAKAIGATSVHISADFSPFGTRRDDAVRAALGDVVLHAAGSPYLVSPGRVVKDDGEPYKVFTPYYRRWLDHGWRGPAESGPKTAHWIDPADLPAAREEPRHPRSRHTPLSIPAGEKAARQRWKSFAEERPGGLRRQP